MAGLLDAPPAISHAAAAGLVQTSRGGGSPIQVVWRFRPHPSGDESLPHADLVSYPSHHEGFGNAFLGAIYFSKPVVVNTYAVDAHDIDPSGFETIEMTQLVTKDIIEQTREILLNVKLREEWAKTNDQPGGSISPTRLLGEGV